MPFRRVMCMVVLAVAQAAAARAAQPAAALRGPDWLPQHLIKVLRTTNKAQTHRYVPKVYDIKNTNPYALLRWVRRTAQIEEGGFYFFGKPGPDGKVHSGKILVTLPEHMIPSVDRLMQVIDRAGLTSTSGEKFFYIRPKHRHVHDAGFTALVKALKGTSGDFETDPEANCLLVYAAPSKIRDVKEWLPQIDVPPPQVVLQVTVYEIFVDNESRLGLDYVAWKNGPGRNLFACSGFRERGRLSAPTGGAPTLDPGMPGRSFRGRGRNCTYFLDVPSAFFDFLVVKGKARIMASARLATRNRAPASLTAGDTILYYHTRVGPSPQAGLRPQGLPVDPFDQPEDADGHKTNVYPDNRTVVHTQVTRELSGDVAGIELKVTPVVGQAQISLDVEISLVSHTGFDDKGEPVLAERTVESKIQCRDGQEIILGGYAREVYVERADKVPFLGSIPLIGYFFGGTGNRIERRQVVLVLTPHTVRDFSAMPQSPTRINAALIKAGALRQRTKKVPRTEAGFDQWLLDTER